MGLIYTDIPELEGSKTEISLLNLSELEERFEGLIEQRLSHLCELSESVISDGEEFDIITSIMLSMKSEDGAEGSGVIDENKRDADAVYSSLSLVH